MSPVTAGIYLDNNASTPLLPSVLEAMRHCLERVHGNPSSQHAAGQAAKSLLTMARVQVAALLGATPSEMVFTASATEANHLAILGFLESATGVRRIVTSTVEHPATLQLFGALEARGIEVVRVAVDRAGVLDLEQLQAALRQGPALLSLMWANNETGVCFPVEQVAEWARAAGTVFHCDAVQAAGRLEIDVGRLPVDLLTLSAHKIHGPKGVGALYVRKGLVLAAQLHGQQERRRRGGTENLPGIAGFGAAAVAVKSDLPAARAAMARLRDDFERAVLASHPLARIIGAGQPRVCNTSSICMTGCSADELLDRLDRAGVQASGGAACAASGSEPSHVLLAMGYQRNEALSTVRFSLSRMTRAAELADTVSALVRLLPMVLRTGLPEHCAGVPLPLPGAAVAGPSTIASMQA